MQIEPQEKVIDGVLYRVKPLTGRIGRKLLLEIKTLLGPSVAELIRGVGKGEFKGIMDMDLGGVANAIAALSEDVTPEKYEHIVTTMHSVSSYSEDGGVTWLPMAAQTELFAGRYLSEMKWLAFALEVNYSDFLSVLKPMIENLNALGEEASSLKSQTTSTGISTESSQASATQSP